MFRGCNSSNASVTEASSAYPRPPNIILRPEGFNIDPTLRYHDAQILHEARKNGCMVSCMVTYLETLIVLATFLIDMRLYASVELLIQAEPVLVARSAGTLSAEGMGVLVPARQGRLQHQRYCHANFRRQCRSRRPLRSGRSQADGAQFKNLK